MWAYILLWLNTARRESLGSADLLSSVVGAALGLVAHFRPETNPVVNSLLWQIPLWSLGVVVVVRLLLSPYWIWKKDQSQILALKTDFSDEKQANVDSKLGKLTSEAKRELYRFMTGEIAVHQLGKDTREALEEIGFIKPAFAYTPAEFIEENRPFIARAFKQNLAAVRASKAISAKEST